MLQLDAPAPAQAPAAPAAPQPTSVALPGGTSIPLTGVPRTANEVQGLQARRDILRDQLERALNRRNTLVDQLSPREGRVLAPEARVGVQQRLNVLDERILQIEREQSLTEQQLSGASPQLLAEVRFQNQRESGGRMDEDEAIAMSFGTFGVGIVLTLIYTGWRRRRGGKRAGTATAVAMMAEDDPRMDRLTQTVDAMAEELERIGEGQRFVTQLLAKRQDVAAIPVESRP